MKRTININFQGQLITIEETAYHLLNQYIQSLKDYFRHEADGNEIVNDIENRIAELFGNRLKHGIPCITDDDVTSIINTIGRPEEFDMEFDERDEDYTMPPPAPNSTDSQMPPPIKDDTGKSLFRRSNDKILGGVCSGLAHYLKIDPVFARLFFALFSGLLFWVYIVLWIVLPAKPLPNNVSKRFYRNPNDRFIGGVCGGIAAYFKVDTWIPRVVFLLPLIFNVFGIARLPLLVFNNMFGKFDWNINIPFVGIYIILWIVMPKAATVKQKLEMMGEDEYLKSIRAKVSDNIAQARSSRTEVKSQNSHAASTGSDAEKLNYTTDSTNAYEHANIPPPPSDIPHVRYASHQSERSGCLNFIVGFLKVVFFGIVGIVTASLMISLFVLIFTGSQFISLQSLFVNQGFEHTLLWISIILTLIVPAIGVIVWMARRSMKAKSRPFIGYTLATLWFIGIIAALTLGFKVTRKFSVESLQETNIELTLPTTNKLYVEMERYDLDYFSVTPGTNRIIMGSPGFNKVELDRLPFLNVEEDSLLFNNIELRMKTSKDTLFHVKTIFACFDKNYKTSKSNLKEFDFTLKQNDSVLLIPQFFKTPKKQGFRNQFVVVEIFVPSGSKLEVSEDLAGFQSKISSSAISRKYGEDYSRKNSLEWNSDEEYVLEGEKLTETKMLNNSL